MDSIDGTLTALVSGSVDVMTSGTYTITYSATDSSGNTATAIRTIEVQPSPSFATLILNLDGGWNLIGVPVNIGKDDIGTLQKLVADQYGNLQSIWMLTPQGWISWNSSAPVIATLSSLDTYTGYWMKLSPMRKPIKVSISGRTVTTTPPLMHTGWNLRAADQAIPNIGAYLSTLNATSMWGYQNGMWESFIMGTPVFLNSMQSMQRGVGYYVLKP